jgi:hypothetical protein
MYDMCTICKNTQYVPDMYMKSVCFSAFILHISGTDRCKIGVRYLIFWPVSEWQLWWTSKNVTRGVKG